MYPLTCWKRQTWWCQTHSYIMWGKLHEHHKTCNSIPCNKNNRSLYSHIKIIIVVSLMYSKQLLAVRTYDGPLPIPANEENPCPPIAPPKKSWLLKPNPPPLIGPSDTSSKLFVKCHWRCDCDKLTENVIKLLSKDSEVVIKCLKHIWCAEEAPVGEKRYQSLVSMIYTLTWICHEHWWNQQTLTILLLLREWVVPRITEHMELDRKSA